MEKADSQIRLTRGREVPTADPQRMKVGGEFRPTADAKPTIVERKNPAEAGFLTALRISNKAMEK